MSFHEITGIKTPLLASAEQFPVFLFPDVTGDCVGLLPLARELQAARGNKSQIYIWHDPKPSESGKSLSQYAEQIKDEIIKLLPAGPCFIGGYSFGGSLGLVVAQKLEAAQRRTSLFVIDTPSIEGSQLYLQAENPKATKDLLAIFKYATSMAFYYTNQRVAMPSLDEDELRELSKKNIDDQIAFLKEYFLKKTQDNPKLKDTMEQYTSIVSQNLLSLIHYQTDDIFQPFSKLGLFLSEESLKKYDFSVAKSWEIHCRHGEVHQLSESTHLSLLKESKNEVAAKMAAYFKNYFRISEIMIMLFKPLVESNPTVDLLPIFYELEKSKPQLKNKTLIKSKSEPHTPSSPLFSDNPLLHPESSVVDSPRISSRSAPSSFSESEISPEFSQSLPSLSSFASPPLRSSTPTSRPQKMGLPETTSLSDLDLDTSGRRKSCPIPIPRTLPPRISTYSPTLSSLSSQDEVLTPLSLQDDEPGDISMRIPTLSKSYEKKEEPSIYRNQYYSQQLPATFFTLPPSSKVTRTREKKQDTVLRRHMPTLTAPTPPPLDSTKIVFK